MPPGVVTLTSTVPALPAGAVAVICVSLLMVKPAAAVPPNATAVAPVNPVPVIVTVVPPATMPVIGERLVMVGGATAVMAMAFA